IFEPTLRQCRLRGLGVDEGNARELGSLACCGGHRREVGAEHGVYLLLSDQTLGLALADLGLALMVDHDDADLGSTESRQALVLSKRQRQIGALVDNLDRSLDRSYRVDSDLRG